MSDQISFVITQDSITVSYPSSENGQDVYHTKTVTKGTAEYDNVLKAIKEEKYEDLAKVVSPEHSIHEFSEGFIKVKNGVIYIDDEEVPGDLSQRIINFANEKLPYMPLVNFFRNLNQNPSYRAKQNLFRFLESNHYSITPDGCFVAFKKIRNNYTDSYTGKFDNTPGKVVSMPRNKVNEDPNQTCSNGLHVASYDYAQTYAGEILVEVKVNPKDVVAVPYDYNNAKMRVCEYTVLGIAKEKHTSEMVDYDDHAGHEDHYRRPSYEEDSRNNKDDDDYYYDDDDDYDDYEDYAY